MSYRDCIDCKWVKIGDNGNHNCLNPINDMLYDWFNASTGDIIKNIRRSATVYEKSSCDEFAAKKKAPVSSK